MLEYKNSAFKWNYFLVFLTHDHVAASTIQISVYVVHLGHSGKVFPNLHTPSTCSQQSTPPLGEALTATLETLSST